MECTLHLECTWSGVGVYFYWWVIWRRPWSGILVYTYDIRSVVGVYTPVKVVTEWLWCVHSKLECTLRQGKGYDWFSPSVCPSVCPSITPFSPCSHHCMIMKFSGVITMDKSDVHAKGQGQRSKVKFTEVNTQLSRFRTLTPVWIHIWQWNHAHSWKQHGRGALLFFKVICQISRSHGSKNCQIWPRLGVSGL